MSNKPVIDGLKRSLADSYTLALKTQNYHWNVEGLRFTSLHALFEQQYGELALAVDELAERIRALGEKSPGSYAEFSRLSAIKEGNAEFSDNEMVKDLYHSHLTTAATLKKALSAAQRAEDEPTADLLIGRIAAHEKTAWMLKSSLPAESKGKAKAA